MKNSEVGCALRTFHTAQARRLCHQGQETFEAMNFSKILIKRGISSERLYDIFIKIDSNCSLSSDY